MRHAVYGASSGNAGWEKIVASMQNRAWSQNEGTCESIGVVYSIGWQTGRNCCYRFECAVCALCQYWGLSMFR
jgi:hypothetical protein